LEHGHVECYAQNRQAKRNIKDPKQLPVFKPRLYEDQSEYRLALVTASGLELMQHIAVGIALAQTEQSDGERARDFSLKLRGKKASRGYMRLRRKSELVGAFPTTVLQASQPAASS
jgi:hypothetical protein